MWDERLVSPRDMQRGTPHVYKKPGSVRPARRLEPLTGCSQTGLHLPTGSLPVVCGTTGYVQRFPAARVNHGGRGRGERLRASCTQLQSAGPDSGDHHKCMLAYPSVFICLTTGPVSTTSVFSTTSVSTTCASSTILTVHTSCCVPFVCITCSAAHRHSLGRFLSAGR